MTKPSDRLFFYQSLERTRTAAAARPRQSMYGSDEIIDHVYSAALDADGWPAAVKAIRAHYRSSAAGLYAADLDHGDVSLVHLDEMDPDYVASYVERFLCDNPWSLREMQLPGRVRHDRSLDEYHNARGYYRRTALFNEWMKPQDFIYTLGVNLSADKGRQIKFYLYRPSRAGPFSSVDITSFTHLTRHLMNAVRVTNRLRLFEVRTEEALNVIDRLPFGVVFLDDRARVTQANLFAQKLFERRDGLAVADGAVVATCRDDTSVLAGAIRAALALHDGEAGDAPPVTVRRSAGTRPLSVNALPIPRGSRDPFQVRGAAVALIIADPEQDPDLPTERLQRRYSLSASEANLALSLAQGIALREAAEKAGLTYETARWYLKSTFQKTGTSRQADLVRLLLSDPLLISVDR